MVLLKLFTLYHLWFYFCLSLVPKTSSRSNSYKDMFDLFICMSVPLKLMAFVQVSVTLD